ncbi:MAG: type II toxin-antitoxin system RelE/ParE family toxin [Betaproteobacteria bacterium]|nr:type II toxin-antitoxin system RelE/ParE family toxin [Betaproteobacteria bacterium]
MKRARFLAAARQEHLAEIAYYAGIEPGLGMRFADAVEEATSRALAFPSAGSPFASGTRRVLLKDFPFSLIYRVESDGILIIAVAPHARKPGYWRSRARPR